MGLERSRLNYLEMKAYIKLPKQVIRIEKDRKDKNMLRSIQDALKPFSAGEVEIWSGDKKVKSYKIKLTIQ